MRKAYTEILLHSFKFSAFAFGGHVWKPGMFKFSKFKNIGYQSIKGDNW